MKTRILYTKIWSDDYFAELDSDEKLAFIYFLTNDKVNIIWTYELSDRNILFETGLTKEKLAQIKEKFMKDSKFLFKDGYVKICNAYKFEKYVGKKNERAKQKERALIPSHTLDLFDRGIDTSMHTPSIGTINHNTEVINNNNINNINTSTSTGSINKASIVLEKEKTTKSSDLIIRQQEFEEITTTQFFEDHALQENFVEFIRYREETKMKSNNKIQPMGKRAVTMLRNQLSELEPSDAVWLLQDAMANGYQSVVHDRLAKRNNVHSRGNRPKSFTRLDLEDKVSYAKSVEQIAANMQTKSASANANKTAT